MPPLTRLSGADATNLLSLGRPAQADVPYARAVVSAWLAAHPTATPADLEAAIQTAIAVLWPSAPVQILVHVFDLTPRIGVWVANPGEPIPAAWWVTTVP
jgi:hypothetical protein